MTVPTGPTAVTLTITCRTSPDPGTSGQRHPITIAADGTIITPHDLDSERLAVALGGYLTCLELVDTVSPVFREWLLLQRREAPLPITSRDEGRSWVPLHRARCCPARGVGNPVVAAEHARDVKHLAQLRGADLRQLRRVVGAVAQVAEDQAAGQPWWTLWRCGVRPECIAEIDQQLGLVEPMGHLFYLAVLCRKPDLPWLRKMLQVVGRAQRTAEWLAWTYRRQDSRDPAARVPWLRLSVPVRSIVALREAGHRPEDVEHVAEHWRITTATAALLLLQWQAKGLQLTAAQLTGPATAGLGYPPRPPGVCNVERLRQAVHHGAGAGPPQELGPGELALAIVEHGSVAAASRAIVGERVEAEYAATRTETLGSWLG